MRINKQAICFYKQGVDMTEYEEKKREQEMVDQWHRAQKAMADDIIDMLQRHTKHARFTYGTRERLSTGFLFEIKKYLKEVVKDDQRI